MTVADMIWSEWLKQTIVCTFSNFVESIYLQGHLDMCTETETVSGFCSLVYRWVIFDCFSLAGEYSMTQSISRTTNCFPKTVQCACEWLGLLFQWMFISPFTIVSVVTWTSFRLKFGKRLGNFCFFCFFLSIVWFHGSLHFLCNFLFCACRLSISQLNGSLLQSEPSEST